MDELPTFVLSSYNQVFMLTEDNMEELGDSVVIPRLPMNELLQLNAETIHILSKKRAVEYITDPVAIVGDIHGNIRELVRAFIINGKPPQTKYVFLGDYVDRNEFSVEVLTLLFSLFCLYPDDIILLRGNHECRSTNANYGFKQQVMNCYNNEDLWESFNQVFDYLPVAAIVNNSYFCVHGGISPSITSVKKLELIRLPLDLDSNPNNNHIKEMLWADPSQNVTCFGKGFRGQSITYGNFAVFDFLQNNNLQTLIRGHEKVDGFKEEFQGHCVTVYSTSVPTQGPDVVGYFYIDGNQTIHRRHRQALPFLKYEDANFYLAQKPRKVSHLPLNSLVSKKIIKPNILTAKRDLLQMGRMKRGGSLMSIQPVSIL